MSDKFKPGDRVIAKGESWKYQGKGTVIQRTEDGFKGEEAYIVKFDTDPINGYMPYAKFLRKLTKLEKVLE